jgi:hypothetical protein
MTLLFSRFVPWNALCRPGFVEACARVTRLLILYSHSGRSFYLHGSAIRFLTCMYLAFTQRLLYKCLPVLSWPWRNWVGETGLCENALPANTCELWLTLMFC